ncbi:hypothetical protein HPP92_006586 [Vanilla planifolia]|uniref:Uncharacterized protein n=1 Tax=Vanilla planifolia TaxID=51239 RepID=A0A835RP57_VANPL|nr:hypothetical protein HPP92_006586 [Vanilla planifolia]
MAKVTMGSKAPWLGKRQGLFNTKRHPGLTAETTTSLRSHHSILRCKENLTEFRTEKAQHRAKKNGAYLAKDLVVGDIGNREGIGLRAIKERNGGLRIGMATGDNLKAIFIQLLLRRAEELGFRTRGERVKRNNQGINRMRPYR